MFPVMILSLTYSDFGFHKWAGRKRGSGDINSYHSTTYPRELTIIDDQGNKVTINLLNTPDYEYAAGKITYVNWQSEKSRRRKKTLYILLPAGSQVFLFIWPGSNRTKNITVAQFIWTAVLVKKDENVRANTG
jgi:hypothetical protein